MRKTLLVLINEVVTTVLRPSFLFTLFGLPIIAALIFGIIGLINRNQPGQVENYFSPAVDILPSGYIDQSGIIIQQNIDPLLIQYENDKSAREDLSAGKISGYYIIPKDFMQTGEITYIREDFNPLTAFEQSGKFGQLIEKNLLTNEPGLAERYIKPLVVENVNKNPEPEQAQESALSMLLPTGVTVLFYIILVSASTLLLQSITKEKENRVLEILLSSMTTGQMLTGKIIALGLVGLLQTGVWIGASVIMLGAGQQASMIPMDATIPVSFIVWALIFFLGGYLLYASLMAGVGAMVPNLREASQATSMVIMPMIVPLVMMSNLIQDPNGPFAIALSFIPLTSPVAMLTRMAVDDIPIWQVLLSAGLLILFAVWVIRVISVLFRGQVILGGQPFSRTRFLKALIGKIN
jgi:ABC-2 type transport system permease protein